MNLKKAEKHTRNGKRRDRKIYISALYAHIGNAPLQQMRRGAVSGEDVHEKRVWISERDGMERIAPRFVVTR